jgi:hypothetical protein
MDHILVKTNLRGQKSEFVIRAQAKYKEETSYHHTLTTCIYSSICIDVDSGVPMHLVGSCI